MEITNLLWISQITPPTQENSGCPCVCAQMHYTGNTGLPRIYKISLYLPLEISVVICLV